MVEIRRGGTGDAARDRLPWLEPVEDEDDVYASEGGYGGLILAAILVLVAIALLTAGILWYRGRQSSATGNGQIIKAEPGPYKVRPPNPGGMTPDANGEVTYGTSAGQDVNSPIDLGALPEQPMRAPQERPAAPAQAQAQPQPQSQPAPGVPQPTSPPAAKPVSQPPVAAVPPPALKPAPVPKVPVAIVPPMPTTAASAGGGSGVIQLGAFSSEAKAKDAWKSLSARFAGLRDLGLAISAVESGDKTLYRLRATGAANGARLCAQLRVAGESCAPVN